MRTRYILFLLLISFVFAAQSYSSEKVPKFTDADLQRHNDTSPDAPGINIEPAIRSRMQDVSGTWKFVCCSGKYWGEVDLTMDENNVIKGRLYDMANKSGGTIDGTVKGKNVLFSRNKGEQDYKLTLSDDGNMLSGFFVGIHDGSVGTEVTLTRVTALPQAEKAFTSWREAEAFGKEMDIHWKDGFYPAVVEGRNQEGRNQFRAQLQPFPKKVWWFYWWFDQLPGAYEDHRKKMITEGFQEINLQVFTDAGGARKYQTGWIKYGR
jgi:hypothetical protein